MIYVVGILILLFATWLRTHNLLQVPVFHDEGFMITWARLIRSGDIFAGWEFRRWLNSGILALFNPRI